jgi:hypothetical protein
VVGETLPELVGENGGGEMCREFTSAVVLSWLNLDGPGSGGSCTTGTTGNGRL